MQLPSLQDLKRLGPSALTKKLDPSALERGLQYLREGGFRSLSVDVLGSKGFRIGFTLDEEVTTCIDMGSSSQPLYSECTCYMANSAKLCKHQAIAAWVTTVLAQKKYDLARVDETVFGVIRQFEDEFQRLKAPAAPPSSHPAPSILHRDGEYLTHPDLGAQFTGIVLCLPQPRIRGEAPPEECWTPLPQVRSHQDRLLPDFAIPFYRETDLPHPRWRSPITFRGMSHDPVQSAGDASRRRSLVYLFSDGTRIPVSELLYHKYASLVPHDLLPVLSNLNEAYLQSRAHRLIPEKGGDDQSWDLKTEAVLLSVVETASRQLKHQKVGVFLAHPERFDSDGLALPLRKIDFAPPPSLRSGFHFEADPDHVETLGVRLRLDLHPDWIWHPTYALQPERQEIFLHPFHAWLENHSPEMVCDHHREFERFFNLVQDEFDAGMNEIHAHPPFEFVKGGAFVPRVHVHSNNGSFSLQLGFDWGTIDGIPLPVLKHLRVLQQGLRSWGPEITPKRPYDRRFLSHTGVAALVQHETLRYLIRKDRPYDKFLETLKKRLAILLNKIEGAPESPRMTLELFCSRPIVDFLESYCNELVLLFEERPLPLILKERSLLVSGAYAFYLKVIYSWLSHVQKETQGKVLIQTKDGFLQNPGFDQPETLPDLRYIPGNHTEEWRSKWIFAKKNAGPEALIRAFLPLQNEGVTLTLDGQPIEELEEEDFVSEFVLDEKPDQEGRIDWFELQPKFFFKGVEIDEEQARNLTTSGMISFQGRIYRLNRASIPSLEKLTHFWDQLAGTPTGKKGPRKSDRIYRLPKHSTLELLALRASGVRVKGGPIWQEIVKFYDSLKEERPPLDLPPRFLGELKPYQHRGVQWIHDLYRLGLGGILADDMGLGKTVQTLVFLETLRVKNELGHVLIVVPTSLTYNWFSEATRFTPDLPVHIFQSREIQKAKAFLESNPQGIVIATYGLLAEHEALFSSYKWTIHVYDEAQNLKTITAKRTTVSRKLPARFKLALTGTPLENHMGEFYSLVDLVVPGSLGSFEGFRKSYMQSYAPEPVRIEYLKTKTRPLVLRRTKSSILKELPQKTESTVKIPFTEKQLAIYRDIALSWNSKVRQAITEGGESKSQLIMLTALLRLRQACSAPGSIPNIQYTETPPKLTLLLDNLKAIIETGESALVFTQFLGTFDLLAKQLKEAGIPFFALHGKVPRKERESQLRQFQEHPDGAVMLMTLKTGGVGLNLTKASYVFHLEPWWNPAVENQATDRTHRIGQTKPVQVYRYIMSESVEEKIEILKSRKSSQFNALFSDVETTGEVQDGGGFSLSQSDFEYLLGV